MCRIISVRTHRKCVLQYLNDVQGFVESHFSLRSQTQSC